MCEIWKDIPSYEGLYQASNCGNIRSLKYRNSKLVKILHQQESKNGYMSILLSKNGKHKLHRVHRLVASCFIPNPHHKEQVDHKIK